MSSTSLRSRRSCNERSRSNSPGSSVIGVSSRKCAHCSRVKTRYGLYCWSGARISMNASRLLIALARPLFSKPGHRGALGQRRLDIRKTDPARLQQHEQMKHQVGALGDQMRAIVLNRRDHGLHRLFAEFLGAVLGALVEQLLRIRGLAARRGAGIDGGSKIMNGETRHQRTRNKCSSVFAADVALL